MYRFFRNATIKWYSGISSFACRRSAFLISMRMFTNAVFKNTESGMGTWSCSYIINWDDSFSVQIVAASSLLLPSNICFGIWSGIFVSTCVFYASCFESAIHMILPIFAHSRSILHKKNRKVEVFWGVVLELCKQKAYLIKNILFFLNSRTIFFFVYGAKIFKSLNAIQIISLFGSWRNPCLI